MGNPLNVGISPASSEQNTNNVFNSVTHSETTTMNKILTDSSSTDTSAAINATFAPVINITNTNGDFEDKIRNILDEQQRKFKAMLEDTQTRARRLSYA